MTKNMLIDAVHPDETRVVIADDDFIEDFDFVTASKAQVKGNIYLAKITRVEPSLQACFVEYGGGKQGFLPFSEIHPDYYQIPMDDKKRLIDEEAEETAREEAEEEEALENRESRQRSQEAERPERGERADRGDRNGRRGGRRNRFRSRRDKNPSDEQDTVLSADGETIEPRDNIQDMSDHAPERDASDAPDGPDYQAAKSTGLEVSSDIIEPVEDSVDTDAEEPVISELGADQISPSEEMAEDEGDAINPYLRPDREEAGQRPARDTDGEEDEEDQIETVSSDDMEETRQRRRGASFKRYRIQEVIKRNQIVLVQVIKEERGNKGVSLTTYISLAGRYCVLMPNSPKGGGVSRKIGNGEQRKKLKEVVAELKDSRGLSAIVRTAGLDRTKTEIKRDYDYLVKLWSQIREDTIASVAPAIIYEESDVIKRCIRDLYTQDVEQVIVQGEQAYKDAKNFMKMIMPSHAPRVKQHKGPEHIFANGIEEQLSSMFESTARLPSGGYIVLQPTEALISIDVNSGRSTSERNVEETAIKTNLEAAREVARQLRLRDLAGLIVIDFIDMYHGKNRRLLEKAVKDALKHDRAKIQVGRISAFGLMELSRQRLRPSIAEASSIICPHCEGTGSIRSVETAAIQIIRSLEREASSGEYTTLRIFTNANVVMHLFNEKRQMIEHIEQEYNVRIVVEIDAILLAGKFRLIKVTPDGKEIHHQDSDSSKRKGRRGRRGGRGRGRDDRPDGRDDSGSGTDQDDDDDTDVAEDESSDETPARRSEHKEHRHGSRDRDRDRGPRPPRDRQEHRNPRPKLQDSGSEGNNETEAADATPSDGSEPPRERGPRRRGGRGRRRERGDRPERSPDSEERTSSATVSVSADSEQRFSSTPAAVSFKPETSAAPRPVTIHPSQIADQPAAIVSDSQPKSDGPKRKGWWSNN